MSTTIQSERAVNHLPEIARNATESAKDTFDRFADDAKEFAEAAADSSRDAMKHAADTAKHICRLSAEKAGETLATSKEYARRNPVPVLLGALAVGAALGYLLMASRRKPTFVEHYAEEPMSAVRDALLGALAPVTHRVHSGYDAAMDGAGKAMDRMHRYGPGNSFSHRLGRLGNNLKFW